MGPARPGLRASSGALFVGYICCMKDNFSGDSSNYSRYRPQYPPALFDFILRQCTGRGKAWDCATGNGQTASMLSFYFDKVFATDISSSQLAVAEAKHNVIYSRQPAERVNFPDNQFDLITVSQAMHWFRLDDFYREVNRTARPGALFATWTYSLFRMSPAIDKCVNDFYMNVIGEYWDEERRHVDDQYRSLPFPFPELTCPAFFMEFEWSFDELKGYLNTWSAVRKYIMKNGENPVEGLIYEIEKLAGERLPPIIFPLSMRAGRIEK